MHDVMNKRQRKKQHTKENVTRLQAIGASKAEQKALRNQPEAIAQKEKVYKKKSYEAARHARAKVRREELKRLGVDTATRNKMAYWGDKKYRAHLAELIEEAEYKGNGFVIYWRPKTEYGFDPYEEMLAVRRSYGHVIKESLIDIIRGLLKMKEGLIGNTLIVPESSDQQRKQNDFFYGRWQAVYRGKGVLYRNLLIGIATALRGLYGMADKADFMHSLLEILHLVNPKQASQLRSDLHLPNRRWRG